jgi:hypothetical protein
MPAIALLRPCLHTKGWSVNIEGWNGLGEGTAVAIGWWTLIGRAILLLKSLYKSGMIHIEESSYITPLLPVLNHVKNMK